MATAVEPTSTPSAPGKLLSLPAASLIGAIYIIAALVIAVCLLPALWAEEVTPKIKDNLIDWMCWLPALVAVVVALGWFGRRLAGDGAPKGVHGGAFLMVCAAFTIFFIARAVAMWTEGSALGGTTGIVIAAGIAVGLGFFAVRFFTGRAGERWMVALEEQGWFSAVQYKRALGVRVRRLTILGILLVGCTGAWSLSQQGVVPETWALPMPFNVRSAPATVTSYEFVNGVAVVARQVTLKENEALVMVGAKNGVLALIVLVSLWVGFRAVNVPDFAEFLIATEAEMNKVSWSTRRRLAQDTVVVLLTTLIMTLFLLVVDLFWGWLLSRERVGVLPARSTGAEKGKVQEAKW
jgi:preprotein translocase SecE subunit